MLHAAELDGIVGCIGLFMHVCCLNFNKVSVSVFFASDAIRETGTHSSSTTALDHHVEVFFSNLHWSSSFRPFSQHSSVS